MSDIASRQRWTINSTSARNVQLKKVTGYSDSPHASAEHVYNTWDDEPVGVVTSQVQGGEIELEQHQETGNPDVNWRKLGTAREYFSLTRDIPGGERVQYVRCIVENVSIKGDNSGQHTASLKIKYGARRDL